MAAPALDSAELHHLLKSLFFDRSVALVDEMLEKCHVYRPSYLRPGEPDHLGPDERYFRRELRYLDFSLQILYVRISGGRFVEVRAQFKRRSRPSMLPAGWLSPNRRLVKELRGLFRATFLTERAAETVDGIRSFWYGEPISPPRAPTLSYQAATRGYENQPMEWECAICDEPGSSGLADRDETKVRNDFVCLQLLSCS